MIKSIINVNCLFIALLVMLMSSCDQQRPVVAISEIPDLLQRGDKIQLGKEWDFVQNFYSKQKIALSNNGADHQAKLHLAELFVKEARVTGEHGHYYPAALQMTQSILADASVDRNLLFKALALKAGVQLSLHEFAAALETGKKAVVLNPNNAQIHGVLVDCFVELGDYKKAVAAADKMISIKPDIRSYSRISYLREIHGDYDGAIDAMTMAVKAGYPGYEETSWAMQTLGELYMLYGQDIKAEAIFKTILEERADYPFAVAALGQIKYNQGDLAQAEVITKRAMDIIPEVGFYTQLAQIYKDQGRSEEMSALVEEIFVMLNDDVESGHNMNMEYADIHLHLLENKDEALDYALLEYNKRPSNIDVNRILAEIYYSKSDITKSLEHITSASITQSNHPALLELKQKAKLKEQYSSI